MKLLIVGGTGTLGRQVVRHALDLGHEVKCLVRSQKRAAFLKEWGAELVMGNICEPETLPVALNEIDAVIDAAAARVGDSLSMKQVDWEGKVNLINAVKTAGVNRYVFFSILNAKAYPNIPLMDIKHCTEEFIKESGVNYTILSLCGFMQGLIGQYAVPILDKQSVWIAGESTAVAYMDTQDIAKFGVRAVEIPEAENACFPVVGPRAWQPEEIVSLCEQQSGKEAKIARIPLGLLKGLRQITRAFQWTQNVSDRLAFAEVLANGTPLNAPMEEVYQTFGLDPEETTTLESYLQDYYSRILKKLKEIGYEEEKKKKKKKTPFKSQV